MANPMQSLNYQKLSNDNPFPNENIDPKEKETKGFGIKVAKSIFYRSMYLDSINANRARIKENRDYSTGQQSMEQYRKILDPKTDNSNDRAWMNIDWSISSPAPKYVNIVVGDMINQAYKIQFNAVDSKSKTRKEEARDEYIGKMIRKRDVIEMEKLTGAKLENIEPNLPKDMEELEMYMDMEFKEPIEIAMEEIVDWEFYNNDLNGMRPRHCHDLVENNKAAIRWYWDENNNIRARYVDIYNYISSYTDDPMYSDTEYDAEVVFLTIRDLRKLSKGSLTEDELFKIARLSANKDGNPQWRYGDNYITANTNPMYYSYDDYRVQVLDFCFYTTDIYKYEEKVRADGRVYFNKKDTSYTKPEKSKYSINIIDKQIEQCYTGMWIVGTEYIAAYGRDKNITRPKKDGKMSPKLLKKYIVIEPNRRNGTSKSLVELIKPNIDNIQLHNLKMRQFVAEAVPPGLAIDWNSLNSMNVDGKGDWKPLDSIRLYKQKGIVMFDRTDDNGDYVNGNPIQFLPNGIGDGLRPFMDAINFEIMQIEGIIGHSAADGTKPDSKALVGIQKLAAIASNNSRRELYEAYFKGIYERSGMLVSRMVQDKIEFTGSLDQYVPIIGQGAVMSLKFIPKDMVIAEFGIKTEALPTGEELQDLYMAINEAVSKGEIRYEDGMRIKAMNPKKAITYLTWRKKKYQEEAMAEMQQREQITAQREQASTMARAEAERAIEMAKAEKEMMVLEKEYELKMRFQAVLTEDTIKIEQWKTYGKLQEIEKASESDLDETKSSNPLNPQPKVFPDLKK